jgi:hypothetical protein
LWKRIVEKIVSWIGVQGKIPEPFKDTCGIVKKLLMELRLFRRVAHPFDAFAKCGKPHRFFPSSAFQTMLLFSAPPRLRGEDSGFTAPLGRNASKITRSAWLWHLIQMAAK